MEVLTNDHHLGDKLKKVQKEREGRIGNSFMFEGKNIHSSPVDGKLLCSYSEKVCMQRRLNGFAFCIRHILEDKSAPFKQCQFFAKYNKSRCINPVPILEERDYCNSHMQVLGIIPKKLKKKKDVSERSHPNHSQDVNSAAANISLHNQRLEGKLWTQAKNHGLSRKQPCQTIDKQNTEASNLRSCESRNPVTKAMPPLRWTSPCHLWKKLVKRKRPGKGGQELGVPSVQHFAHLLRKSEAERRDLFKIYMFERVEEDAIEFEEMPLQAAAEDVSIALGSSSGNDLIRRLKHQRSQLKQSIKTRLEDRTLTYSVLQSLIQAARENAVQTVNVLNSKGDRKLFRGKRSAMSYVRCAASLSPNTRCSKSALPYSRHCIKHISNDEDQFLYGACTARFAAGSHCGMPVVDLINERPLCNEHALKKMNSTSKEASVPAKRPKRPEKIEKNKGKVIQSRKNLKAQLQKKFAIPTKPMKKSNSHVSSNFAGEDRVASERKSNLKMTFKASANSKWLLEDSDNDGGKGEAIVVLPRSYRESTEDLSPAASDLRYDINTGSLSSPSLISEEDEPYPLMNMARRHHDSFTFDDDEDLLQSNAFAMNRMTDHRDLREMTSPPLSQFSSESLPNALLLGELCSSSKLSLDKPLFDSSSILKQEVTSTSLKSSINQAFHVPVTASRDEAFSSATVIGSIRPDGLFTSQNALMPSDRFSVSDANSVQSASTVALSSSLSSLPATSANWATKFTLPTRNDQLAVTSVGFIRVDASTHTSIYSPPFTSPSLSCRQKADFFKFENNAKQLENEASVSARVLPSYTSAICSLDRKFDAEPPLQKVNPDIFLSTMYTVSESSNT